MTSNFKIRDFVFIEFAGRTIDLHNNFDFASFDHNTSISELKIHFVKSNGSWVQDNEFDKLTFTLVNINYLKMIEPDPELLINDTCLASITFFYHNERDEHFWLLSQELPRQDDDIIFHFESERVIRVNCESVTLEAEFYN